MATSRKKIDVYLERGKKRAFAGALDWPGWCRSGKTDQDALRTLLDYAPRYARVLGSRKLGFSVPSDGSEFKVVEQLTGDASTDFGAPGKIPKSDDRPMSEAEVKRLQTLLRACWAAFDRAVKAASGKELRKGPRGGGRDLDKIVQHVLEAEGAYLARIGHKYTFEHKADQGSEMARLLELNIDALAEVAGSEPVRTGPRGGVRWPPRYYARRSAWHVLDHAWEIEDRATD